MKVFSVLIILSFYSAAVFSQDITGTWNGSYDNTGMPPQYNTPIFLHISLSGDSSLQVYTFTIFQNYDPWKKDTAICKASIVKQDANNWLITEEKILKGTNNNQGFQVFKLKFITRGRRQVLKGKWFNTNNPGVTAGEAVFKKRIEK